MQTVKTAPTQKLRDEDVLTFILGGRSLFTIRNAANGNRYTYKVKVPKDTKPEESTVFFVKLLTGSNNETDYQYLGTIKINDGNPQYFHGRKSRITEEAPGAVAFAYCFNKIIACGGHHKDLEIWHEGKCCRCGRTLTVPESIQSGIGPECASISHDRRKQLAKNYQTI